MRPRRKVTESQLEQLVLRLLQNSRPEADTPVIISTADGDYHSSVGRLLEHKGARVSVRVDRPLQSDRPVTVFLPENAYVGEVLSCVPQGQQFAVDLILIQHREASV